MLSIGKLAAGGEGYYLATVAKGAEEYYTGAGEAPGEWLGTGSEALGMAGMVAADDLRRVLAAEDSDGARLAAGNRRLPGFDLTFSPPKSVSLLWALDTWMSAQVVAAHESAVRAAVGFLAWIHRPDDRWGLGGAVPVDRGVRELSVGP